MRSHTLGWVQLAAIVGALQGLVLTSVLASQRTNRTANRLLAALMAAMSLYLAGGPYYASGLIESYPHFFAINYQTPWVFGPLVYLYARAASDQSWRFRRTALVHFVPVAITTLVMVPVYLMSGAEKIATWDQWSRSGLTGTIAWLDPFKYASGIGYSAVTALYLVRHRREIEHSYSNLARVNLRWLFWLTAGAGGIWVLVTALKIAQVSTAIRDAHVAITMALLVYGIGYMGLRQPEVFRYEATETPAPSPAPPVASPPLPQPAEAAQPAPPAQPATAGRYEHSGLGYEEAARLKDSLLRLMEREQPWKESDLTLADLASRLESAPYKVSEVLNAQLGQTFYDFVNGYRVREVQRRINAGDSKALKMLALAMDAGFASKSAFNEAFKKHSRQTPSAFRQAVYANTRTGISR